MLIPIFRFKFATVFVTVKYNKNRTVTKTVASEAETVFNTLTLLLTAASDSFKRIIYLNECLHNRLSTVSINWLFLN